MNRLFSKPLASFLIICLLVGLSGAGFASKASASGESAVSSEPGGYKQDQFFISTITAVHWGDEYDLDDYKTIIQATKDAGFNLIENATMPRSKMHQALEACDAVQIKCLAQNITNDNGFSGVGGNYPPFTEASIQSVVDELKDYTMLEGYYIWDEVLKPEFGVARQLKDYLKQFDPDKLAYSITLPSYGPYRWDDTSGNGFEEYIDSYIQNIDPDVLGFDYYPFWKLLGPDAEEASLIENDLWRDMGLFRKKSMEFMKPFWFYFQAVDMEVVNDTRLLGHMTREKMGVQMKAALAYGAKTVSYFRTLDMLTDVHGNKFPIYDDIKSLNNEVMNLGNLLFDKQSKQIYHFGIAENKRQPYFLDDVGKGNLIESAPDNAIVSVFGDSTSTAYVLVVNKDYKQPMTGQLNLKVPGQVKRYDKTNNTSQVVSNLSNSIDLQIAKGDAELYMIEPVDDTEAPSWPANSKITVSNVTQTGVKLSWPEAQDNVSVAGYRIYVDGVERMSVSKQVLEQQIANLTPNQTYTFTVKSYDAAGNESVGLSETATTLQIPSGGQNWYVPSLSDNADLRVLQVSVDGKELSLAPSFAPGTLVYTVETEADRAVIAVNASHAAAKVLFDGGAVGGRVEVKLREGNNVFELKVQAENGVTKTYTVTVHRKLPQPEQKPEPETFGKPSVALTDITGHWAESSIKKAVAQQIVSGYANNTFRPDNPVTRAEFIVMLANALKLEGEGQSLTFTDRERIGSWAAKSVAQALEKGIVKGYADGSFRPNATITRMEMAAMIARAIELPLAADAKTGFADDSEISQWAKSAVEAIRQEGIAVGRNGNRFVPNATATRAETVVMLLRIAER
ncbi:S-layer homology domain-containing protein [Paenibacillus sp. GCM10027626]|uniref:S-layer homology domain-containing protein n=1 Tax=Paenibacillus sp. GCM10027626 TaxID=3273411 RepID=UPI003631686A